MKEILVLVIILSVTCCVFSAKQCYHCDGQACLRTSQVSITTACTANDSCVTLFNGFTPIKKNCYLNLSDDEKLKCDSNSNVDCYKCSNDNCNRMARTDHKCVQCTSSASNANCLNDLPNTEKRCNVPRTANAYCYVQQNGSITKRGCVTTYTELNDCVKNSSTCSLCDVTKYGACNTYAFTATTATTTNSPTPAITTTTKLPTIPPITITSSPIINGTTPSTPVTTTKNPNNSNNLLPINSLLLMLFAYLLINNY